MPGGYSGARISYKEYKRLRNAAIAHVKKKFPGIIVGSSGWGRALAVQLKKIPQHC